MHHYLNREETLSFGNWVRSLDGVEYSSLASNGRLLEEWETINETYLSKVKKDKKITLNIIFIFGILFIFLGIFLSDSSRDLSLLLGGITILIWGIKAYTYFMKYYSLFKD